MPSMPSCLSPVRSALASRTLARPLLSTVAVVLLLASASPLWGYAEDVQNLNGFCVLQFGQQDCQHSTFHYDLVRVLARAAGFCAQDAEMIAVSCEATDTGQFQGDLSYSPTVWLQNTARPNPAGRVAAGQAPIGLYFHFGRRSDAFVSGDTCQYSANTQGPCQVTPEGELSPEVDELYAWAMQGTRVPRFGDLTYSLDGTNWQKVEGKSLQAVGVFLHALADSYSHEACLQVAGFQGHEQQPYQCNAAQWHGQSEFGPGVPGLPYTRAAAEAVWQQLLAFRGEWQGQGSAQLWDNTKTLAFITRWTEIGDAGQRQTVANSVFGQLNDVHGDCGPTQD